MRLAALLLALCPLMAAGQVYKWVDEKGVTHYSENPPPDKKATKVETGPAVAPTPSPDWRQKEIDAKRRGIERKRLDEAAQRKEEHEEQVRKGRCRSAQRDLDVLRAERPLYHVNEKGERVFLEDKNRPAEIQRARHDVEKYCK